MLTEIKKYLERYKLYRVARGIKWYLEQELRKPTGLEVISIQPEGIPKGYVLLSYMNEALTLKPGDPLLSTHASYSTTILMARTFVDLGYHVDVIHHRNQKFIPDKDYSIVVDTRYNLERLAPFLNKKCVKIFHIDIAHILFQNAAEANRLLALQQRRGVTLSPSRVEWPNLGIEHADYATMCGTEFTASTFRYANKPIYRLPIPAGISGNPPMSKDFEACRKRFFWFASYGMVHKGLDLVLEAFAEMPECHLVVCGPIEQEQGFVKAYRKELYHTANIETIGWLTVGSEKFKNIADRCIGLVLASCSEGGSVGVVECMHAGLIPIINVECSIDVRDFGVLLKSSSIEDIQEGVRMVAEMPDVELKRRARGAWKFARENHTHDAFAKAYRSTIETILARHSNRQGVK